MSTKTPIKSHRQMVEEWKQDPEFVAAYDELESEFTLLRELLQVRQRAGLTQAEVAEKIGTKAPAVTRLETALSDNRHSPSIEVCPGGGVQAGGSSGAGKGCLKRRTMN